jgi:hypothetical protein
MQLDWSMTNPYFNELAPYGRSSSSVISRPSSVIPTKLPDSTLFYYEMVFGVVFELFFEGVAHILGSGGDVG